MSKETSNTALFFAGMWALAAVMGIGLATATKSACAEEQTINTFDDETTAMVLNHFVHIHEGCAIAASNMGITEGPIVGFTYNSCMRDGYGEIAEALKTQLKGS